MPRNKKQQLAVSAEHSNWLHEEAVEGEWGAGSGEGFCESPELGFRHVLAVKPGPMELSLLNCQWYRRNHCPHQAGANSIT